jgi:hypothetical protein
MIKIADQLKKVSETVSKIDLRSMRTASDFKFRN